MTLTLTLAEEEGLKKDWLTVTADGDERDASGGRKWMSDAITLATRGFQGDHMARAQEDVTDALFPPAIKTHVQRVVGELGRREEDWRFRLRLAMFDPRLGAVPWELAQLIDENMLLSDPRCSMVRAPAHSADRKTVVLSNPCRVLFASARRVEGFDTLGVASLDAIQALGDTNGGLQITKLPDVTDKELKLALDLDLAQPFDVFHFSGHGQAEPGNAGIVVNSKRQEEHAHAVVDEERLVEMLRGSGVDVVVLACCHSAKAGSDARWSSLAGTLVDKDAAIPAVVAMQQAIGDRAAATFTRHFYETLVRTRSVDEAVAVGRLRLQAENYQRAVPVLYSRAEATELAAARPPDLMDRPKRPRRPAAVAPLHGRAAPGARASVSLGSSSWGLAADGDAVAFLGYGAHDYVNPWKVDERVQDVAVSQDGSTLVALAGGRLHVASFDAHARMHGWSTTFAVPADHDQVLAVRLGNDPELEVLVAGEASQAIVPIAEGRAAATAHRIPGLPRDAAATHRGFIRIDGEGRISGQGDNHVTLLAAIEETGWLAVDRAECGGQDMTVAAHEDGIVYVVSGDPAEISGVLVPGVSHVHAVRPLGGPPPSTIAASTGGWLQQWAIDGLEIVAPAGSRS
ncbi:MAG: CHAT domain-containing protein [Solirubrobacteraceae bacterium]